MTERLTSEETEELKAMLSALKDLKSKVIRHPEGTYLAGEAVVLYAIMDAIEGDYSSVNRVN